MSPWLLIGAALAYTGVLFALAFYGDKRARKYGRAGSRPVVYALSLAVYCTSWTFFGTVERAAASGWDFLPIYLGPILAFTLCTPVLRKLIRVSKQHNITSVADFIASRYGKAQGLAATVSIMAVIVVLPYIALQLKGVALAFDTLVVGPANRIDDAIQPHWFADFPLYLAITMAGFAMLFGTRTVNANESHQGIIYAIAFESLVKLSAFFAVGLFVCFRLFDGFGDLLSQASANAHFQELFAHPPNSASFFTITLMATAAMLCLPRQFHVTVVENTDVNDLRTARWLFPLYLAAFSLFVIPIAAAGLLQFPTGTIDPDRFMLALPLAADANGLALFAFIGGFSAATSMVIVATVALSTMVCNDIVMPTLMRLQWLGIDQRRDLSGWLLGVRRGVILALFLGAYGYYRWFGGFATLTTIGLLSFAGVLQFLPAIAGGLYSKGISRRGVLAGLTAGFATWGYTLVLPNLTTIGVLPVSLLQHGPLGIGWLNPQALFGWPMGDAISHGVVWSLLINIGVTTLVSVLSSRSLIERGQANAFVDIDPDRTLGHLPAVPVSATVVDLQMLLARFLGVAQAQQLLVEYAERENLTMLTTKTADARLVDYCERVLAGAIGGSSARLMLESTLRRKELAIEDVVQIIDRSAQAVQFNRSLLQAALDHLSQGVSVVDSNLRLVAWNGRYLSLFDYPEGLIRVGTPVADLIRFNAELGRCGPGGVEMHVQKRLTHMRAGRPHVFLRTHRDDTVLEIHGNPMPGGGFVSTFNDITEFKHTEQALREANETLERRVGERTAALTRANASLRRENRERAHAEAVARLAKGQAEQANLSKTRFLAAASHDLLQPLNAARLFASALQQADNSGPQEVARNIEQSLQAAEALLAPLLDISKLDAGAWDVKLSDFSVHDLLAALTTEFTVLAADRGLALRSVDCQAVVRSDRHLLRRILLNFLANAVRYTPTGKVLLGCRRDGDGIRIEVWDTGPGIPADELGNIFEEFHRLHKQDPAGKRGLGLGLSIAERMAKILDHPLQVRSRPGHGTVFSVRVPRGSHTALKVVTPPVRLPRGDLTGVCVLCIDDNPQILAGLDVLLRGWSCTVRTAAGRSELPAAPPDIVLADFHLHGEADGLTLLQALRARWGTELPCILITADRSIEVRRAALAAGYSLLLKPVKAAALRAVIMHRLSTPLDA